MQDRAPSGVVPNDSAILRNSAPAMPPTLLRTQELRACDTLKVFVTAILI